MFTLFQKTTNKFASPNLFGLAGLIPHTFKVSQPQEDLQADSVGKIAIQGEDLNQVYAAQEAKTKAAFQAMLAAKRKIKGGVTERRIGTAQTEYETLKTAWLNEVQKFKAMNSADEIKITSPTENLTNEAILTEIKPARMEVEAIAKKPHQSLMEKLSHKFKKLVNTLTDKVTTTRDEILLGFRQPALMTIPAQQELSLQYFSNLGKTTRGRIGATLLMANIAFGPQNLANGIQGLLDNITFGPATASATELTKPAVDAAFLRNLAATSEANVLGKTSEATTQNPTPASETKPSTTPNPQTNPETVTSTKIYTTSAQPSAADGQALLTALGLSSTKDWGKIIDTSTGSSISLYTDIQGKEHFMLLPNRTYGLKSEKSSLAAASQPGSTENIRIILPETVKKQVQAVQTARVEVQEGLTESIPMKAVNETCSNLDCYKGVLEKKPTFSITKNKQIIGNKESSEGVQNLKDLLTELKVCETGPLVNTADLQRDFADQNSPFYQALKKATCFQDSINYVTKNGFDLNERGYGHSTRILVAYYQFQHQLKVDGVVGPQTWGDIEKRSHTLEEDTAACLTQEIIPQTPVEATPEPVAEPSCAEGDCAPNPETPNYLSNSTDSADVLFSLSSHPQVAEYQTKIKAFVEKIDTQTPLSELVSATGISTVEGSHRFNKDSFEAEKEDLIRQLAKTPDDPNTLTNLQALESATNLLANKIATRIADMENTIRSMDAHDPQRAEYYQLLNYLISLQGLSQLNVRTALWDLNDRSGEVTKLIRFPHQVYALYALQFSSKASSAIDALEKNKPTETPYVDQAEIKALTDYQNFRKLLDQLNQTSRPAEKREAPLTITDINILPNLYGHLVANNAYYGWPTVSFEDAGKAFDSTVLLLPRTLFSAISLLKNNLADNRAYNTAVYELPQYSGMQKGWSSTYAEINSDLPNKQRYNNIFVKTEEGSETKVAGNAVFDTQTGFGLISSEGLQVDGKEARLADKNRLQSVLATFYAPELLPQDQSLLENIWGHITNIDLGEIFTNIDPAIPDRDYNVIESVRKFQNNPQGQALIRLYRSQCNSEAQALECAWKAYCTMQSLVLKKLPQGVNASDLKNVKLGQAFNIPAQVDGAQTTYLLWKLLEGSKGGETQKPQPQPSEEGVVTGGETGVINPPPLPTNAAATINPTVTATPVTTITPPPLPPLPINAATAITPTVTATPTAIGTGVAF